MRWLFCVAWRVKGGRTLGTGVRIATASVRIGLAMTLVFHGGAVCGGAHGPRPTRVFARIVGGQGRPPLRKARRCEQARTGGVEPRPYGSATRGAMGGRPQWSPLRKYYKECDAVKNPPVTASPCQPPLGKGAMGTGDTDCHGQCSHWPRNDTSQEVRGSDGAHGPRPTDVFSDKKGERRGRSPYCLNRIDQKFLMMSTISAPMRF